MTQRVNHSFREGDDFSPIPLISIDTFIDTTFLPDHIMHVHTHQDLWQLWAILLGTSVVFFDNRRVEARPGSVFLVGPGINHGMLITGFTPCRILDVKWSFTQELPDGLRIESAHIEDDQEVNAIVNSMTTELKEKRAGWGALIKGNLFELYTRMIRMSREEEALQGEEPDADSTNFYHELIVHKAQQFISTNFDKPITARDVATAVEVSPRYISSIFNRQVGCSIPQFITQVRMKKAAELLSNYTIPISEVGEQVGYSDQSYFSNVFKRTHGMSPSEYRHLFGID
jgi:AraC-like DNA-binding protein